MRTPYANLVAVIHCAVIYASSGVTDSHCSIVLVLLLFSVVPLLLLIELLVFLPQGLADSASARAEGRAAEVRQIINMQIQEDKWPSTCLFVCLIL